MSTQTQPARPVRGRRGWQGWAARRFGGLPPTFWWLIAGIGACRLGFVVVPFRAYYLSHERHLSYTQAALVMTAFGVGWAVSQPVSGLLADRLGRRSVIVASAIVSATAFMAFGSACTVATLTIAAAAAGVSFDAYRPAAQAMMADAVPPGDRPRALGLLYLALNVGRGIACVAGGLLAEHAFWLLFILNASINLAFGLTVWFTAGNRTRPSTHTRPTRSAATPTAPPVVRPTIRTTAVLRDAHLVAFTAITLTFYLIHMQSVVTLPIVMDQAGTTPMAFGLLLALDPLAVAAVQMLLAPWLDRINALVSCAVGVVLVGAGLAVTGMGTTVTWFAATIPIWVAGEVCFLAVAPGVIAAIAPPSRRGVYFGIWGCTQGVAAVAAPPLAIALLALGGNITLWLSGAAAGALAAVACLVLKSRLPDRPASP